MWPGGTNIPGSLTRQRSRIQATSSTPVGQGHLNTDTGGQRGDRETETERERANLSPSETK